MSDAPFLNFKSILTKQEQIDFNHRHIIFKSQKHKFAVYENLYSNLYKLVKYTVEISVLKEKIYILLIDQTNKTRRFDTHRGPDQIDNGENTILLLQLWRKQIQYIFMEHYFLSENILL